MGIGTSRNVRGWTFLLAGILAGLLAGMVLIGPASAHFRGPLKHAKKHFFTKNKAAKEFLAKGAQAADSALLQGETAAGLASRVASGFTDGPGGTTLATTTIVAPASGFLVLNGIADLFQNTTNDEGSCSLHMNGAFIAGSEYGWTVDDVEGRQHLCLTHTVTPVPAGSHTIDLIISGKTASTSVSDARVTALYVPFGSVGTRP